MMNMQSFSRGSALLVLIASIMAAPLAGASETYRSPSSGKQFYNAENGTVIYRSRMHAKTKRNFEIFSAEEFIAAITQHIPDKGFQMLCGVRNYVE
jgi:hypothetical protein